MVNVGKCTYHTWILGVWVLVGELLDSGRVDHLTAPENGQKEKEKPSILGVQPLVSRGVFMGVRYTLEVQDQTKNGL